MSRALPLITPMRLSRMKEPFNSPDWLFEIKVDGFRALAYLESGQCRFISRNGYEFRGFQDLSGSAARSLKVKNAILDGELCCLAEDGRSVFNALMFRKGLPYFYAFDLLWLNGQDLRRFPLVKRKERLDRLIPKAGSRLLYLPHLKNTGVQLFQATCNMDLEGIVAKQKDAPYSSDERETTWITIKNPQYSQANGRQELFASQNK